MRAVVYSLLDSLTILLSPLGTALFLPLAAVLAFRAGWRRCAAFLGAAAWTWLWISSTPWMAGSLRHELERPFPFRAAAEFPQADAIVVLGGGLVGAPRGRPGVPDLNAAADREWFAAELFRAGRAPVIIVSAGQTAHTDTEPGAFGMRTFLQALGVPLQAIVMESQAQSTLENAYFVNRRLTAMGASHVLLVTSAYHMPRAMRLFESLPVHITPAPADHAGELGPLNLRQFVPTAAALSGSTAMMREYLGTWAVALQKALRPPSAGR